MTLEEDEVEIAVVVVVEEGAAGTVDLGHVELPGPTAAVNEPHADLLGALDEELGRRARFRHLGRSSAARHGGVAERGGASQSPTHGAPHLRRECNCAAARTAVAWSSKKWIIFLRLFGL